MSGNWHNVRILNTRIQFRLRFQFRLRCQFRFQFRLLLGDSHCACPVAVLILSHSHSQFPHALPSPLFPHIPYSFRRTRTDFDTRRVTQFPSESSDSAGGGTRRGYSGAQEVHRLGALLKKKKKKTKQNERIINMENVRQLLS